MKLRNIEVAREWYKIEDYLDIPTLDAQGWRDKLAERNNRNILDDFREANPVLAANGLEPVTDMDEIDHLFFREQSVQPCDDLQTLASRRRIAFDFDPYCPDEILIKQFKHELEKARKQLGIDIKRRGAGRPKEKVPLFNSAIRFKAWRDYKILELMDLEYRVAKEGYDPPYQFTTC